MVQDCKWKQVKVGTNNLLGKMMQSGPNSLGTSRAQLLISLINEPRCEKTGLRSFRPGPTQTGLYSHRSWLGA